MKRIRSVFFLPALAASMCLLGSSSAQADLVIDVTDAGGGNVQMQWTGTLNSTGVGTTALNFASNPGTVNRVTLRTNDNGFGGAQDIGNAEFIPAANFAVADQSLAFLIVNPANPTNYASLGNGILNAPFTIAPTGVEGFSLSLQPLGDARLRLLGVAGSGVAPTSITFNDTFTSAADFSQYNQGTWEWGTPGGAAGDGITLNIGSASAVPEPGSGLMLLAGTVALAVRRRRRKRQ